MDHHGQEVALGVGEAGRPGRAEGGGQMTWQLASLSFGSLYPAARASMWTHLLRTQRSLGSTHHLPLDSTRSGRSHSVSPPFSKHV